MKGLNLISIFGMIVEIQPEVMNNLSNYNIVSFSVRYRLWDQIQKRPILFFYQHLLKPKQGQ
jgi:hypothetical protein